ncbi:hypothetical protein V7S43_010097 [Phytophthora oleae]|uniref:Uncharacterized protein n=1 Tax=Phytophthora oleae TaxID=2107226 RepID=A0ABD3FDA9_9STRA
MHSWYDGRSVPVPVMNIYIGDVADVRDSGYGNRYKVDLIVRAIDKAYAELISMRLKEGFEVSEGGLVMRTFVHVHNTKVFRQCIEWKQKDTDKKWKDYYEMVSAVD